MTHNPWCVLFRVLYFGHATCRKGWATEGLRRRCSGISCNGGTQLSANTHRPKSKEPTDEWTSVCSALLCVCVLLTVCCDFGAKSSVLWSTTTTEAERATWTRCVCVMLCMQASKSIARRGEGVDTAELDAMNSRAPQRIACHLFINTSQRQPLCRRGRGPAAGGD